MDLIVCGQQIVGELHINRNGVRTWSFQLTGLFYVRLKPSGLFSPNRCKLVFMRKLPLLLRERGGVRGNGLGDDSFFLIRGEAAYFSMECGPRTREPLSGRSLR